MPTRAHINCTARAAVALAAAFALAALAGCGGATKTVSVSSVAAPTPTTAARSQHRPAKATAQTTAAAPVKAEPSSKAQTSATHTAPEPAFTQHGSTSPEETQGTEAASAVAVVEEHGYTPQDASVYHPDQTLRVLVGTRTGSGDGYDQRAFFFLGGHYLGTDSSEPSASVRVVSQSDTEVVLAYALYRAHDPLCCPGGGQATVHFQLNDGQLVPLQPIPPARSASGSSRQ